MSVVDSAPSPGTETIRTPDQRLRVFVSSTLKELAAERAAAQEAVAGLRLAPVLFELGARPHPPRDLYRAYIDQSDVFIGIYGGEYGWVAPGMAISGLEDEYILAAGKPRLIYVKSVAERDPRLRDLLARIAEEGTVSYKRFATAGELRELIGDDLALLLTERFQARNTKQIPETEYCHLPSYPTRIIGREHDLEEVVDLLARSDVRLVTLTGPGGTGKTRLAVEAAWKLCRRSSCTAHFVSLADVSDPALVPTTIGSALGVREAGGVPYMETLKSELHGREMLVVIDNFEQVVAAAGVLSELVRDVGDLKLLVTSREALQIYGEREFRVTPLSVPGEQESFEAVTSSHGVQLFVERGSAVRPGFMLDAQNADAVREICMRLDGLPLAIELAAARVRVLSPEAIRDRLSGHLDILQSGGRDRPQRQKTMQAAIEWSYDLLDENERVLASRLAVFAGGFSLPSAEAVCNPANELGVDTLDAIASLAAKSLLQTAQSSDGHPRFTMLEVIRFFALDRLAGRGELELLRDRHCGHFADMAARNERTLVEARSDAARRRLDEEYANMRDALAWALECAGQDRGASAWIDALLGYLFFYWYVSGRLSEGRQWSEQAVRTTERLGRADAHAMALFALGSMAMWQGDFERGRASLTAAVAILRETGNDHRLSVTLMLLGVNGINQGRAEAAKRDLEEALSLFRAEDDRASCAIALTHLGDVASEEGNNTAAREYFEEGLQNQRAIGAEWPAALLLNNLGGLARAEGDYETARRHYSEALRVFESSNSVGDLARCRHSLAYVALRTGDIDRAKELFCGSLSAFRDLGNRRGIGECLLGLAAVSIAMSDGATAARLIAASERVLAEAGAGLWPADAIERERDLGMLNQLLAQEDVEREMSEGRQLSIDDAAALACAQRKGA